MENDYSEQIDYFLRNQMTEEERLAFKQQIEANPVLKQQVREHLLLIRAIQETGKEKDKEIINSVKKSTAQPLRKKRLYFRSLAVAASVALLFVVGHDIYYYAAANHYANELSVQMMSEYRASTMRGVEDEDVTSLDVLFTNVNNGENLEYTIEKLSVLYVVSKDEYVDAMDDYSSQIAMELAIAYIKSGNRDKAIDILDALIAENQCDKRVIRLRKYLIGSFLHLQ